MSNRKNNNFKESGHLQGKTKKIEILRAIEQLRI